MRSGEFDIKQVGYLHARDRPDFMLSDDEVHLWAISLDSVHPRLSEAISLLSDDERHQASGFHFDAHRHRFIVGRSVLRMILGEYVGVNPREVKFRFGPYGKPELSGPYRESKIQFNLSHSGTLGILAVTRNRRIGVDVERIRELEDADELVARFFSKREAWQYRRLPKEERPLAFFKLWTRKEAWLKATGQGIGTLLHRTEVTFLPGESARILSVAPELGNASEWQLVSLQPGPQYIAAVATEGACEVKEPLEWSIPHKDSLSTFNPQPSTP